MSTRAIVAATGTSHPTVAALRDELEDAGRLESFTSRTSADGRTRPATQPPRPEPDDEIAPGMTAKQLDALTPAAKPRQPLPAGFDGGFYFSHAFPTL